MKQQGFGFTRIFSLSIAAMVLNACSGNALLGDNEDSILRDKSLDYAQSKVIQRIFVPQGLNDSQIKNDLLTIPAAQRLEQPIGIEAAPRPDFVFAETGSMSAHLTGAADNKLISVAGSLSKVRGHVAQFWSNQGIVIEANSSLKTIETEWFSLSEKAPANNFISRWVRSLTNSDDDTVYGRVKVDLTETPSKRIELSLSFLQFTQQEITQTKPIDWTNAGRTLANESEITFELLRYLGHSAQVVQITDQTMQQQQMPLLGKDQYGRPLVQLNMSYEKALPKVLAAMSSFDVGSHDELAKKIYFTHTSQSRTTEKTVPNTDGIWGWFKGLHSGTKKEPGIDMNFDFLLGGTNESNLSNPGSVYSSTTLVDQKISLADKKGFKVWMGGEIIYVFEDENQGEVSESGEYTYVGQFQLYFKETLSSVYVQILNNQGQPAAMVYAEEILWLLQQNLAQ